MPKHIAIVGAGASGLACAISAASHGAQVSLIEKDHYLGGTVSHSLIHTLGGLYTDCGDFINEGLPITLTEKLLHADKQTAQRKIGKLWVLNVDPLIYQTTVEKWIASLPNITVYRDSSIINIEHQFGHINCLTLSQRNHPKTLEIDSLVDASGSAFAVKKVDAHKVINGDALAGLIFQIQQVEEKAITFPKNIAIQRHVQKAVTQEKLPKIFNNTWFDTGLYSGEVYAKLSLVATQYCQNNRFLLAHQLQQFLPTLSGFSEAVVIKIGELGIRDGGTALGEYCLTVNDIKAGKKFKHPVARCAWPIEYWHPEKGVSLDYFPAQHYYEIPLESLQVLGMSNMWVVGKCLSAEKLVQASARVVGSCWAMGDNLGKIITT